MKSRIVFEYQFEVHLNSLSGDIKQTIGFRNMELRRKWDSRYKSGGLSSYRMYLSHDTN